MESSKHPRQSDWAEQSDARPSTGVSSPGSPGAVWPYRWPYGLIPLRVIPYVYSSTVRFSLTVNPCLPCDRASVRFCWQPSSLLLGRICPRVQSYVVLPQAWASPYQCLHMLPPFRQDVASVAPFSGRLASLPLRQAVNNK